MGIICNKQKLSEILGKAERTLTEWQKAGMPILAAKKRGNSNEYDTEAVINWIVERETSRPDVTAIEAERLRLTKFQADKVELEVEVLRGNLLQTDEVELTWSGMVLNFRSKVLAIPAKLSPQIANKTLNEIEQNLKSALSEALSELSLNAEYKTNQPVESDCGESAGKAEAATGNKNKRVGKRKPKAKQRGKRRAG